MNRREFSRAGLGAAGLAMLAAAGGCRREPPDLAAALAPARGGILDPSGRDASVDDLLQAARGRPASVSFAYVGCSGRTPRMARLQAAEAGFAPAGDLFHIVLNVVDEPSRYPEVVRDLTGSGEAELDPNLLRIVFVRKGELWPREPSAAAEGVMNAIGLRYGRERFAETVTGIGLFGRDGRLAGIRY